MKKEAADSAEILLSFYYAGWTRKHSLISSSYKIKTYWNILTKLMAKLAQTHTVSCGITNTQCAPLLLLGKRRCDNLAQTRLYAAYPAWPSLQLQWCVPAAHPRLRVVEVHRLCPSRTPKGIHIRFEFESTLHCHNTVLWNSTTHRLRCCEVSAVLHFTALWRRAGKLKISWVTVSAVPYL